MVHWNRHRLFSDSSARFITQSLSKIAIDRGNDLQLPLTSSNGRSERGARNQEVPVTEDIKAFVKQRRKKGPIIVGYEVKWLLGIETRVELTNLSSHLNWIEPIYPAAKIVS